MKKTSNIIKLWKTVKKFLQSNIIWKKLWFHIFLRSSSKSQHSTKSKCCSYWWWVTNPEMKTIVKYRMHHSVIAIKYSNNGSNIHLEKEIIHLEKEIKKLSTCKQLRVLKKVMKQNSDNFVDSAYVNFSASS